MVQSVMAHWLFITGKLAEPALRRTLAELGPRVGIAYSVAVLPITVVALATTSWISRHCQPGAEVDRVLIPGLCQGDLEPLRQSWPKVSVVRGPNDLRELPEFFGQESSPPLEDDKHDIEILAEINHADRLGLPEIIKKSQQASAAGADVIDLGATPGSAWRGVGEVVKALRDLGLRVSLDSFDPVECAAAAKAGVELILSVNQTNCRAAPDWGCEVVAIPDTPANLEGLRETVAWLTEAKVPLRIDPVLEPIGFGFAASLGRYAQVRQLYPRAAMLMGVGNLTELTEVDSAGVNLLLAGFCQEVGIRSVLTTEVINWSRSSVRELDLARRLVYHALKHQVLPKHVMSDLVMLRDPRLREQGAEALAELGNRIQDKNIRLFAERGMIHVLNQRMSLRGDDPFALFAEICQRETINPTHAFYLGYEMAKAVTALTLGKNYYQDQALRWGFLTREENRHRGLEMSDQ